MEYPSRLCQIKIPSFSRFWHDFQLVMATELCLSTSFHPQIDGQSKRTIQTLEDMLTAYALHYTGRWDHNITLVEFCL